MNALIVVAMLAAAPSERGVHIFRAQASGPALGKSMATAEFVKPDAGLGVQLSLVLVFKDTDVQLDPSVPVLLVPQDGDGPVFFGPKDRCEPSLHLVGGNHWRMLRVGTSREAPTGAPLKQKCVENAAGLTQVTAADPKEKYALGKSGTATMLAHAPFAYAGRLELKAGAEVKPHKHEGSMEIALIEGGHGTFTLNGVSDEVEPGDAVFIPSGVEHSFRAKEAVRVTQFYLPPGPEERFRAAAEKKP